MSQQRKSYTAKFKAKLVLEVLKGEKTLNAIAIENGIHPNLLRNWKTEFLDNASNAFDGAREESLKAQIEEEKKQKEELAKKIGQLTMQVDWLEKKSAELLGPDYESQFGSKPFDF